jgi:hypothetical protein
MAKKLTIDQIIPKFKERGWKLLSKEYHGSQKQLSVICPEGHETTITWNNFQRGQGCRTCAGNEKFTLEQVRKTYEDQGCELLEQKYVNSMTVMHFRCSCGEISKCGYGNFRQGRRCQNCKGNKISQKLRTSDDDIKEVCEKHGCKLIRSFIYKKHTRIEYVCKCGKTTESYWFNFKKFPNCWECGKKKKSGANCYMYNPDREAIKMRKKFRKMCGQHIHRFMKATGQTKTKSTHLLLGYTPKELQDHILNHPNYEKCKNKEWHVDHIFPIQAFLDHNILDLKLINNLDNLMPIEGVENLSKANKYDEKSFLKWVEKKKNEIPK